MTEAGADRVTWLGHATLRLDVAGVRVLTDPLVTRRLGHLRRRMAPPAPEELAADLVLISHAHLDHLHRPSLRRVARVSPGVPVLAPYGATRYLEGLGLGPVTELRPGEQAEVAGVAVTAVKAVHPGGRLRPSLATGTLGFVVAAGERRAWFAGDTDLFDEMDALGPLDLAAIPIAGWWRTLGPGHLDEGRAAEAAARVDAARVVPIHWGTYAPEDLRVRPGWMDVPIAGFETALAERGLLERLLALRPGDSAAW